MYLKRFVLLFLPIVIIGYGVFFEDLNAALDDLVKNGCEYRFDISPYFVVVSPTGEIWAVTDNALFEFDGENWQTHLEPYIKFNKGPANFIEFDREGRLWLGGDEGVMIYDGSIWTFYKAEEWDLPRTKVTSIAFDPDGRAWIGLARSGVSLHDDPGGGISIFDGETWTTFNTRFGNTIAYDDISAIQFDPQGRPWIGTSIGTVSVIEEIISFSTGGGNLPKYYIPEENTISAVEDEDGAIHYTAFTAQTYSQNSKPGIPSSYRGKVNAIDFDDQGDAWIYIHKNLYRFDGKVFRLMQITEWGSRGNVTFDPRGNVWFGLKVYNGIWWRTYNDKNSCIEGTVYNIAFDHSGTAWVAHNYYPNAIGLTTFENRPYRIPLIFLGLRAILVPSAPAFRWFIPVILTGIWILTYQKNGWASIAKSWSKLHAVFSFQEISPDDKRWYQAVLAAMPYFLILVFWNTPSIIRRHVELESSYKWYSFEFLFHIPFLVIIPFLIIAWKRGWPVWSGTWMGFGVVFTFFSGIFFSRLFASILAAILLFIWLYFRDRKTGVLATLPIAVLTSIFLYSDFYRNEFFIQLHFAVLSLTAFVIVLVRKWVWLTVGGLLLCSYIYAYVFLKSGYSGTEPLSIPIYIFLLYSVTFLPLLLCKYQEEWIVRKNNEKVNSN